MSNETKEGNGRTWTNVLLFLILMAILAVGLGVWEARQAAKSRPVKEEKAKDNIPNAAVVPCPCPTPKPVVKKPSKKKTVIHKTATQPPKPAVVPVAAMPPVTPVVEKPTKKELLADVDPDFNRTKFVPDEEPQKVVVVNRTVDISAPVQRSYYPHHYYGGYYTPTYTPTIVPAPSVVTPAPSVVTPPTGHTGGNGGGSNVGLPGGHSGF